MQRLPTKLLPPVTVTQDAHRTRSDGSWRAHAVDYLPYAARKTRTHSAA
jgi:hypothetical protein